MFPDIPLKRTQLEKPDIIACSALMHITGISCSRLILVFEVRYQKLHVWDPSRPLGAPVVVSAWKVHHVSPPLLSSLRSFQPRHIPVPETLGYR